MGFFDRPQLPGAQPMQEPPGNDIARQMLLQKMMRGNINPYGMSPDGMEGMEGGNPLFATGLHDAPAFGQTSRGDVGDPYFRQSFLGGPQYGQGQDIWSRIKGMLGDPGSGSMSMNGPQPAPAGSRVALNSRPSPPMAGGGMGGMMGGGGSGSSLIQMLMQIMGNGQQQAGPQSFFNGRRVGSGRRFYNGRTFYDAIDPDRDDQEGSSVPRAGSLAGGPLGAGSGSFPTVGNAPRAPRTRPQQGGFGLPTGTGSTPVGQGLGGMLSGGAGRGGPITGGPTQPGTQVVEPRGPRKKSNYTKVNKNAGDRSLWTGGWQYDSLGRPIGPGGVHYTGSQHEFSGGGGGSPASEAFRKQAQQGQEAGGPSYWQWLQEIIRVRKAQADEGYDPNANHMPDMSQLNPAAANWYLQHQPQPTGTGPSGGGVFPGGPTGGNNPGAPF